MALERLSEDLIVRAFPLDDLGVSELAWSQADALLVVAGLEDSDVAILGGDVYCKMLSGILPMAENWACERRSSESLKEYAMRSRREARSYIQSFPTSTREGTLFVLVLCEEETAGL